MARAEAIATVNRLRVVMATAAMVTAMEAAAVMAATVPMVHGEAVPA